MSVFLIVAAILASLLTLFLVCMWLPVRIRLRATFARGRFEYGTEFKPPLLPWYIKVPGFRPRRRAPRTPGNAERAPRPARPGIPPKEAAADTGALDRLKAFMGSTTGALARFEETYADLRGSLPLVLRALSVAELRFRAAVGTGDAGETALLAGSLRALSGIALSMARRKGLRFEDRPRVSVRPVYDRQHLSVELRMVTSIVPWRALVAAWALYRSLKHVSRPRPAVSKSPGWNTKA